MSSAWGNQVERWRAGINAWVTSETDTTATIRVEAVWQSVAWGYNVSNGVSAFCDCDGSDTPYVGTGGVYASRGETRTISMYTRDFTVPKTGSDRDVQCGAGVRLAGGYHDGTSRAYCTVRVSHRTWYQPHRPANFAARRSSDTSQSLTWAGDYTGLDGGYPWSGVYVDRGRDGATPSNLATLGWAATNYSDNSTEAGHRYDYRLYSYGPGDLAYFNSHVDDIARVYLEVFGITASSAPSEPEAGASGSGSTGFAGGTYRCTVDTLNVRDAPGLSGSVVASYHKNQTVVLDSWYKSRDGYIWGRYTGASSGKERYVAVGRATGKPEADDYLVRVE